MGTWVIEGGTPLEGTVAVSGAKNSITKLMVLSMLSDEPCVFNNAPEVGDSQITEDICMTLGARIAHLGGHRLQIHTPEVTGSEIPAALGARNRLAIMMLPPLLHRTGRAIIPIAAGGDKIGPRPVNFHLEGYRLMGAQIEIRDGVYDVQPNGLRGEILSYPSPV
jgi:UDP-N-acetylglucosamine 1-carboxyvinyltransferase